MATLTSRLVVRILDEATRPARQIAGAIRGIARATVEANREQLTGFAQRQRRQAQQLQGQLVGTAAAAAGLGYALNKPRAAARDFQSAMTSIQQKAGLSDQATAALAKRIRDLAPTVNQTAMEVSKSMDTLMGFGLDAASAEAMTAPIGMAASAYDAATEDLAQAAYAVANNLKVPVDQTAKALDVMAVAGKAGGVELKDMAGAFPELTAGAQALGETGVESVANLAAALEVTRDAAGTASQAATNIKNLHQKIYAPQTIKAFQRMGLNIREEMNAAKAAGETSIEAISNITNRALKGDLSRLGDLFQDAEVQNALRPLIQNMDRFRKIREEALGASGDVARDYAKQLRDDAAQEKAFKVAAEESAIALGNVLRPAYASVFSIVTPFMRAMGRLIEAHPVLTRFVVGTAAAFVGLRLALLLARFAKAQLLATIGELGLGLINLRTGPLAGVSRFLLGPFIRAHQRAKVQIRLMQMEMGGATAAGRFRVYASGLIGLLNPLKLVRISVNLLKWAFRNMWIATGIGAVVALASILIEHWRGVLTFFQGFGRGFVKALGPLGPPFQRFMDIVKGAVGWIGKLLGGDENEDWSRFGEAAGKAVGGVVAAIAQLIGSLVSAIAKVGEFWTAWRNRGRVTNQLVRPDDMRRFANQGVLPLAQRQAWAAQQLPARPAAPAGHLYQTPAAAGGKGRGGPTPINVQQTLQSTYHIHGASTDDVVGKIGKAQQRHQEEAVRGVYADLDVRRD